MNSKNRKSSIGLAIISIILGIAAIYFYKSKSTSTPTSDLFETYYIQPAEIDNVKGSGPFRNKLEEGYYYFSVGKYQECLNAMKKVILEDSRDRGTVSMGHYIRAHTFMKMKKYAKAKNELTASSHFGVERQKLLIQLLEGQITEEEYNERKMIKTEKIKTSKK